MRIEVLILLFLHFRVLLLPKKTSRMAFCYRFKWRIPHPTKPGQKVISFKVPVPFKSRRFTCGRFGYSNMMMEGDTTNKLLGKAMRFLRNKDYDAL